MSRPRIGQDTAAIWATVYTWNIVPAALLQRGPPPSSCNEPAIALYRRCGSRAIGATRPNARTSTLIEGEMLLDL